MFWFFFWTHKKSANANDFDNDWYFFVSVKATGITEKCVFFLVDKFYVDIEDEIKKLEKYNI